MDFIEGEKGSMKFLKRLDQGRLYGNGGDLEKIQFFSSYFNSVLVSCFKDNEKEKDHE